MAKSVVPNRARKPAARAGGGARGGIGAWLGLAMLLAACAAAPTQEMSDARRAIDAARSAGAEEHVRPSLREAERLLSVANSALEAGEYQQARSAAVAAKSSAMASHQAARAIAAAREGLSRARAAGRSLPQAEGLLVRAVAAADRGDTAAARALADSVLDELAAPQ